MPRSLAPAVRIGADALRANPLRTLLSTLGIVMGVAALVAVLALGDGMEQFAREQIGGTTDLHAVTVAPQFVRVVDGTPVAVAHPVAFSAADAAALRGALRAAFADRPGHAPRLGRTARATSFARAAAGAPPQAVELLGTEPALLAAQQLRVEEGRAFTPAEAELGAAVALASRRLLSDLAPPGRPRALHVGDTVRLGVLAAADSATAASDTGGVTVRIVGILADTPAGAAADEDDEDADDGPRAAVLPPDLVRRVAAPLPFGPPGGAASLLAVAGRVEDAPAVRAAVERWLAGRWPDWRQRVRVGNRSDRVEQARRALLAFKLVMGAITGISLLVGGVGVMNVLLASVAERTREIGVRRAVGATRADVRRQFLAESIAIAGLGSLLGVLLGLAGAFGVTAAVRAYTEARVYAGVSAASVLSAVAVTVLVGLTFGVYPARRAAALSPIDAIRHET
jgi:putative ABC transport system permease protein